jgi:DNA-binding PadR family transcriptional regulator
MDFNRDKVDAMTLALLHLVTTKDKYGYRAWKGFDWGTMDRLYEKGYISNPKGKAKSIALSEDGAKLSARLFKEYFEVSAS